MDSILIRKFLCFLTVILFLLISNENPAVSQENLQHLKQHKPPGNADFLLKPLAPNKLSFKSDMIYLSFSGFSKFLLHKPIFINNKTLYSNIQDRQREDFIKARVLHLYYGITIGIILLLMLYHYILFFIVRERLYFYYVIQTFLAIVYFSVCSDFFSLQNQELLSFFIFALLQVSFLLIMVWETKLKYIEPGIYKNLIYTFPLYAILPLVMVVIGEMIPKFISGLFYLGMLSINLSYVIRYIPMRGISRNLSILSWTILISGTFIYFIQTSLMSGTILFNHGFELGLLLYNILFALALANKLSTYKKEKDEAEKMEIKAMEEKEQIIHEQNDILEKLIAERNKELIDKIQKSASQKLEIEKQNEIINKSIVEIDKLNNELIQKNEEIQKQNIELEAQHVILEKTVKKRTRKLMKAQELAITAEKLKTSFLNNLTQEINTPMSAITGYSGLISDKSIDKDKRNEYLTNIINYVEILLDSVDNIVTLSKIQAGIIKHKPDIINHASLYKVIKSQAEDKIAFSRKEIKLEVILENQNTDVFFELDHPKLWQIIGLLIDITLRQIKNGQILINHSILESSGEQPSGKIRINIRIKILSFDNSLEQIGTNYFTAMNATEFKYSSQNEMGMAIIKGISEIIHAKTKLNIIDEQCLLFEIKVPAIRVGSKNHDN